MISGRLPNLSEPLFHTELPLPEGRCCESEMRGAGGAPEHYAGSGGVLGEWSNCYRVCRVPVTGA